MMPEVLFEVMEFFYNWTAIRRLSEQASKKSYDLIYERYALFNFSGLFVAKKRSIPIVLEVNYTSRNPLVRKRSKLLQPFANIVENRNFHGAHGLATVSTALKEQLVRAGVEAERIEVVPNAADPKMFDPEVSGENVRQQFGLIGKGVIGFVGGFYPWHGLDLLIDALPPICSEVQEAAILLIGDGPIRPWLEQQVQSAGLRDRVHFVGSIPHSKLPEYVAAFNVAVMPDSNDYGSPMKIYEYMSMGKPVVAPKLGPLEDGILDGSVGLLFTPHNVQSLIGSLATLLKDPRRCVEMGNNARAHVLSKHTWKRNAERIMELVQRIRLQRQAGSEVQGTEYQGLRIKD